MTKPLSSQIACIERELAVRRRVYPRWVASQKMRQEKADHEIECMEAVLDTLRRSGQQELNFGTAHHDP